MNKEIPHIELVVFDLDGTLIRSHENIYHATVEALSEINIEVSFTLDEFVPTLGLHFKDIFDQLGLVVDDIDGFFPIYKKKYMELINYSSPYPNAISILEDLNEAGIRTALLTTKIQDQADKIIDHFEMRSLFDNVTGRRLDKKHKPDPEQLLDICTELSIQPEQTMMIGDTELDIQCGKNARAVTAGVTFGYRTKQQVIDESPDFLIDDLTDLRSILLLNGKDND